MPETAFVQRQDVRHAAVFLAPVQQDLSREHDRGFRQQAREGHAGHAFPAAAFADQCEHFAAFERERDIRDGGLKSAVGSELNGKFFDVEQRHGKSPENHCIITYSGNSGNQFRKRKKRQKNLDNLPSPCYIAVFPLKRHMFP